MDRIWECFLNLHSLLKSVNTEWVKIIGGLLAFAFGAWRYVLAQRWKRREFIAQQIRDFEADKKIQAVLTMLDWRGRYVPLRLNKTGKVVPTIVDEQLLQISLLPCSPDCGFTDKQAAIRDCFDRFLDALVRLEAFVQSRLISQKELEPYIRYWLMKITNVKNAQHEERFYMLLHRYIEVYDFRDVRTLIERYVEMPKWPEETVDDAVAKIREEAENCRHALPQNPAHAVRSV